MGKLNGVYVEFKQSSRRYGQSRFFGWSLDELLEMRAAVRAAFVELYGDLETPPLDFAPRTFAADVAGSRWPARFKREDISATYAIYLPTRVQAGTWKEGASGRARILRGIFPIDGRP